MIESYKFLIQINRASQRILIIDDNFFSENYEKIDYMDFDAVWYTTKSQSLLEAQLMWLNPLMNNSFMFKPFFFHKSVHLSTLKHVADGLYDSYQEEGMIETIIRLQNRLNEIRFKVIPRKLEFWTQENINIAVLRFLLSRNDDIPASIIKSGATFGYMVPIQELLIKYKYITPKNVFDFKKNFVINLGYIEKLDIVNIVHLSPECYTSHLIYSESCPRCNSVDIIPEDMIHHFKCANVSSESSYMRDSRLICPKCNKEVRHIGVDYDRPAGVHFCRKCSLQFVQPIMKATCMECGTISSVESLVRCEVYNARFTPLGSKMLSQYDEYMNSDDIPMFDNVLSFNSFKDIVRTRITIANNHMGGKVKVMRLKGNLTYSNTTKLIDKIYSEMPSIMISYRQSTVYMLFANGDEKMDKTVTYFNMLLKSLDISEILIDYLEYEKYLGVDEFIKQI